MSSGDSAGDWPPRPQTVLFEAETADGERVPFYAAQLTRFAEVFKVRATEVPRVPGLRAADLLGLMVEAGYDPERPHPDCYRDFSYAKLAALLSGVAASAAGVGVAQASGTAAADPLAGLDDRLDRLLLTASDGGSFVLSTASARNIVGIVREWLRTRIKGLPAAAGGRSGEVP